VRYISTRGLPGDPELGFWDILLEGLAPDGGLYLPREYPQVGQDTLAAWRSLLNEQGYAALAQAVLSLFIDDIPDADLRGICERAYNGEVFSDPAVVPVTDLGDGLRLAHLSNGPTAAFKDLAMQLLGQLFEYELTRRGTELNILGATSGDTGSAAEYAMRGRKGVRVFMLTPAGRMSPFQQAQMFSIDDPAIVNVAVDGVFDDCQDLVKEVAGDLPFKQRYSLGAVNSINWARLVAQVVYYIAAWLRVTESDDQPVSFCVPTGNFGNICAGHVARMMGLPIRDLVLATNENNVLDEFFRTGVYRVRSASETHQTSSRRWTSPRPATSSASSSICWDATVPGCARCSGRNWPARGSWTSRRSPSSRRSASTTGSSPPPPPTPTAWPPSPPPGGATVC
jgi:threonine synthase